MKKIFFSLLSLLSFSCLADNTNIYPLVEKDVLVIKGKFQEKHTDKSLRLIPENNNQLEDKRIALIVDQKAQDPEELSNDLSAMITKKVCLSKTSIEPEYFEYNYGKPRIISCFNKESMKTHIYIINSFKNKTNILYGILYGIDISEKINSKKFKTHLQIMKNEYIYMQPYIINVDDIKK